MNLNRFITDPKLEQEGVWIDVEDVRLKIARVKNPKHEAAFAERMRPYRGRKLTEDEQLEVLVQTMADHVLLGWEGTLTLDGEPLEYSRDNAVRALRIRNFADMVTAIGSDLENFRNEQMRQAVEVLAKN